MTPICPAHKQDVIMAQLSRDEWRTMKLNMKKAREGLPGAEKGEEETKSA